MNRKHILYAAIILLAPNAATATDLTGKWKEVRREIPAGTPASYTDTTVIDFRIGNEYLRQKANGFGYRGNYKVSKTTLDMGALNYTIIKMSDGHLTLKDDNGIYEFARIDNSDAENNSYGAAHKHDNDERITTTPVSNLGDIAGSWDVFKRSSSATLQQIDYDRILRSIAIYPEAKNGRLGGLFAAKDGATPSWNIDRYEGGVLYCTGKDNRQIKIVSYAKGELIVQEDSITYFFKQFK